MVMPGVTTRKRFVKRASRGDCALLSVCHAISIAITTVLPEPVAIFECDPRKPGVMRFVLRISSRVRQSAYP